MDHSVHNDAMLNTGTCFENPAAKVSEYLPDDLFTCIRQLPCREIVSQPIKHKKGNST